MIIETHRLPSVLIAINIQHRHDNEIHLVQHLCHAWVFSIFCYNLKMNHGTLSQKTQIPLSRTTTKYIFGWSYFLFFIRCRIKDSKIQSSCDAPWFSGPVHRIYLALRFFLSQLEKIKMLLTILLFPPYSPQWLQKVLLVLLMIILRYHQTFWVFCLVLYN